MSGRILKRLLLAAACMTVVFSAAAQHLFIIEFKQDGVGPVDHLAGASGVALSGDGNFVYSAAAADDAVTAFERESFYGTLGHTQDLVDDEDGVFNMAGANAIAASPDQRHVYATSAFDNSLLVFARDATTDALAFVPAEVQQDWVNGVMGLGSPTAVAVSGDDTQVFVTADLSDSVAVFSRDATNDSLTFVDVELDGAGGANFLAGASDVAVSPDHLHVYVTSFVDDALTVFRRDGDQLTAITAYVDGVNGIDGLDGASGLAISPDGRHVYVVAENDDSLATFARDAVSGELVPVDLDRDGVGGVDGLSGAEDVAVSPLGNRVFVAARTDNGVSVFRRSPITGVVDFLEVEAPAVGLNGVSSLAVSPDGLFVYASCFNDDAVTGLYVALCDGNEATGDTDEDATCDDQDQCLGDDLSGDSDVDSVCDDLDICPGFDDNQDSDADSVPDGCDACEGDDASGDTDNDQVCDDSDVCPGFDDGADADADTVPDGCDLCLGDDAEGDEDGDQVCDDLDVCDGDDASGDPDGDGVCSNLDCAPDDGDASTLDFCGVCGGDNSSCGIFLDGFESGNTTSWSATVP